MASTPERMSLEDFLHEKDPTASAAARAAAARMDDLQRQADVDKHIERAFVPWAGIGAILFVVGVWFLWHPGTVNRWFMVLCLAALPMVCAVYAWRVRDRTKADNAIQDMNKSYFLPIGGLYFPPSGRPGAVIAVDWTPPEPDLPLSKAPRDPRKRKVRAGRIW